jgi:hypothetical protein
MMAQNPVGTSVGIMSKTLAISMRKTFSHRSAASCLSTADAREAFFFGE